MIEEIRMKINELIDLFKKLEEQNAIKEKCKRWKGKQDEEYWFIIGSGEVCLQWKQAMNLIELHIK